MNKASYKGKALATILILSIATSYLGITLAANQTQNSTGMPTSIRVTQGNVTLTSHKITPSELQTLRTQMGTYNQSQNYNRIIEGHGTGLSPPTADTWQDIAQSGQVIESISYQSLPPSYDNSATVWFPPIGNQDGQGSCTAWAVGYYVKTFQEAKEHGWDLSGATWDGGYYGHPTVSYQNRIMSPSFLYHLINSGTDSGSNFEEAINLINNVGECTWQKMPYNPADDTSWPSEAAWLEAASYRGDGTYSYQYLRANTDSALLSLKSWLTAGNLAVIAVDADQYDDLTAADVWTSDEYQTYDLNHANTIVGYDDTITYTEDNETRSGAFKVANSWGEGNGWEHIADGFYWISYNTMKELSTASNPCITFQDLTGYQPEILASFRITHSVRGDCEITFGLGTHTSPIVTKSFSDYVLGGSAPFCVNNIVFDLTEFKNDMTSYYNQPFFMRVFDKYYGGSSSTGNIVYFAVGITNSSDTPKATINNDYVNLALIHSVAQSTVWLSPTLGPANGAVTINGAGFPSGTTVNVSYINPLTHSLTGIISNYETESGNFTYQWFVPDLLQNNNAGDSAALQDSIVFNVADSLGGSYNVTYAEYRRGITQIADYVAEGIYGNNTDLGGTAFVYNCQSVMVYGRWFSPGAVNLFWDTTSLGTATVDSLGAFSAVVEVPATTLGEHTLIIRDNCDFCINLTCVPKVSTDYTANLHTKDFTISLTSDYPIEGIYYKVNGGAIQSVTANGQPIITTEGTNNTLEYWATWNQPGVGIIELPHVTLTGIQLDKTAPTATPQPTATQSTTTPNPAATSKPTQAPATPMQTPPPSATSSASPYPIMPDSKESVNAILPEIIVVLVAGVLIALVVVIKVKGISKK